MVRLAPLDRSLVRDIVRWSVPVRSSLLLLVSLPARQVLAASLDGLLRLVHPFMPYLTEELWQRLHRPESFITGTITDCMPVSLSVASLPPDWKWEDLIDTHAEDAMHEAIEAVRTSRSLIKFVLDVLPSLK